MRITNRTISVALRKGVLPNDPRFRAVLIQAAEQEKYEEIRRLESRVKTLTGNRPAKEMLTGPAATRKAQLIRFHARSLEIYPSRDGTELWVLHPSAGKTVAFAVAVDAQGMPRSHRRVL